MQNKLHRYKTPHWFESNAYTQTMKWLIKQLGSSTYSLLVWNVTTYLSNWKPLQEFYLRCNLHQPPQQHTP